MLQMTDVLGHPPISSAGQKLSYLMSLTLSLKKKKVFLKLDGDPQDLIKEQNLHAVRQ